MAGKSRSRGPSRASARSRSVAAPRTKRTRGTGASFVYDSLKALILDLELKPGTLSTSRVAVSRSPTVTG